MVSTLAVLASCTGARSSADEGGRPSAEGRGDVAEVEVGRAETSARPELEERRAERWSRAPAAEGDCPWAGLRFDVDDFVEAPERYDTEGGFYCMNYSGCEWRLAPGASARGVVIVEDSGTPEAPPPFPLPPEPEFGGTRLFRRVSDGWISSFDRGEFGGSLWWFSPDGTTRRRIGDRLNVHEIIVVDGQSYVVTSLRHLTISEGVVYRLEQGAEGWGLVEVAALPRGPAGVALLEPHVLLVADDVGLLRVDVRSGEMSRMHQSTWRDAGVVGARVERDGTVVLGGRHAIVRLTPTARGYEEALLVPPACTTFDVDWKQSTCRCGVEPEATATTP